MINEDLGIRLYQAISGADKARVMKHWHASSIAQCPRAQYYARLGVEPLRRPSAAKILRWGAGHALEASIRPHIETVWGKTESNKRLTSEELDLTGEFDNLYIDGNKLIEVKSVHDYAFTEVEGRLGLKLKTDKLNKWKRPIYTLKDTPYLHHELQNHAYVMLLRENGTDVEGIDYVYLSLSGRIVVYSTKVQQKLLDNVSERLKLLNEAWGQKKPPLCMCHLTDHPLYDGVLTWCDYKNEETGKCCDLSLLEGQK